LDRVLVSRLLVMHAISGWDSTSSLFGHGKVGVFRKLRSAPDIQPFIDILESQVDNKDTVAVVCWH